MAITFTLRMKLYLLIRILTNTNKCLNQLKKIRLNKNRSKTIIMTTTDNIVMRLANQVVQNVKEYAYFGYIIKLGVGN